jgi:hypothetical protein
MKILSYVQNVNLHTGTNLEKINAKKKNNTK